MCGCVGLVGDLCVTDADGAAHRLVNPLAGMSGTKFDSSSVKHGTGPA